jgi:hypothetical protein
MKRDTPTSGDVPVSGLTECRWSTLSVFSRKAVGCRPRGPLDRVRRWGRLARVLPTAGGG